MLEPDLEEMKRFKPVFNKFKQAFFDGNDSDAEIAARPRPRAAAGASGGRGRGRGAAASSQSSTSVGQQPAVGGKRVRAAQPINEAALEDDEDDGQARPQQRRRLNPAATQGESMAVDDRPLSQNTRSKMLKKAVSAAAA